MSDLSVFLSISPDRDGLQYVDSRRDVVVYPSITKGLVSFPINGQSCTLLSHEAAAMLLQLAVKGRLNMITKTIQSLCQLNDGTKLQAAFPDLADVKDCIRSGLNLPDRMLVKIKEWESLGATEVNFDFVELGS